ncbi:CDK-activating kinase assembly factor [Delitschia confertaspora ATCC 74209]|uniref:RNA polymerase II transcription factor B subunit 3 n=1 Tax=Delitschia confertaspora ATCC 74209 TaxID=1513339 RepID=A0A9P4MRW9_9PLEO|nr:CDK-activating kinase assembly factor [Delitschia confertaspora ATCC 74209]
MSRPAQRVGATPTKRLAEDGGESPLSSGLRKLDLSSRSTNLSSASDICPVCKSSRYLNQNMKFLINPECYHKMCESCVDRIFSRGPAPCPIAGCKRTLRKVRFRDQTFEDLALEREVDIRRRIGKVFNKTQDDFETLKDYNNYLEIVEDCTWNLINKVDVEETEKRLQQFAAAQSQEEAEISGTSGTSTPRNYSTPDPSSRGLLKKSLGARHALDKSQSGASTPGANGDSDTLFTFKGLKKRIAPPPEKPYDPFGGWSTTPEYYVLQDFYDVGDWLNKSRDDPAHLAGGQDIRDFYTRALCDAFSGFGVFVEDEVAGRTPEDPVIATENAAVAAVSRDVNMDDVF